MPSLPNWLSRISTGPRYILVASTVVIVAALTFLVFVYAPQEQASAIRHWRARLEVVAADRAASVERAIEHYFSDAETFADYPTARYLASNQPLPHVFTQREKSWSHLHDLFRSGARRHALDNIWLSGATGRLVINAFPSDSTRLAVVADLSRTIVQTGERAFLHRTHNEGDDWTYFGVPVRSHQGHRVVGSLVVAVNTATEIFPAVTARWGGTTTGEAVLVEDIGDSVAVLAGPRKGRPRPMRFAGTAVDNASVRTLAGDESFNEAVDYNHDPVYALGRRIHNSPWAIVAKVDRAEVTGQWTHNVIGITVSIFALIAAMVCGAYAILIWLKARYTLQLSREAERNARADEELRKSYAFLSSITEQTTESIFAKDKDHRYSFINSAGAQQLGLTPGQIVGKKCEDLVAPAAAAAIAEFDDEVLTTGAPAAKEQTFELNGRKVTRWVSGSPIFDSAGKVTGLVGIARDMTELKATQQRLRMLFDNAAVGILNAAANGRIIEANPYFAHLLGYQVHELRGADITAITPPDDIALQERWMRKYAAPGRDFVVRKKRYMRKDGSDVWVRAGITVIRKSDGTPDYYLGVIEDITAQHEVEKQLREAKQRFDVANARAGALLAVNVVGIAIGTRAGAVREANDYFLDLIGYSRAELEQGDVQLSTITPAEYREADRNAMAELCERGASTPYEKEFVRKDGERVWALVGDTQLSGDAAEVLTFVVDITSQKSLELQYQHAQKMEAVGRLAGGVAHDFNNVLTAIKGIACLAIDEVPANDPHRSDLIEISQCADRATALTRQLLAFSRKQVLQPRVFDMRELLQNMTRMLKRLIGEDIVVDVTISLERLTVHADPAQIEQVILNLVVNARDAMPNGGSLSIGLHMTDAEGNTCGGPGSGCESCFVTITVSDTGIGMDAETTRRIFEPFFTTKEQGKGTGLGLATVYGIVQQSSGSITVDSTPGKGTTFKVRLPYSWDVGSVATDTAPATGEAPQRKALVLVVEDEDAVRRLITRTIQRQGHRVIDARNAGEALLLAERHHEDLDLVITDMIMPGMSGCELVRRLRELYNLPNALFISGYADGVHGESERPDGHFMEKPFEPRELVSRVSDILSQSAAPA